MDSGQKVHVNVAGAPYDVIIRAGLLGDAGKTLAGLFAMGRVAVVLDSNSEKFHGTMLVQSLKSVGWDPVVAVIPAGEEHKNLSALLPIYDRLLNSRMERSTPLVAMGGGVVTDIGGFVAATVLRGIPLVQVPTTLLAMVDASIGGKTGVDHAAGKNLIGAFHQPKMVIIDPETLRTLPASELRNGLAECIKHELIRDKTGFAELEKNLDAALKLQMDVLTKLIAHNVSIKARVVEADPLEKGERAHLNFGHTFGHAIESVSRFSYSHGQSVALGMTAAAYVSQKLKLLEESERKRIIDLIKRAGLPTGELKLSVDEVVNAMRFDKKVKSGKVRFVLLEGIGKAIVRDDVPPELVSEAVESLRES